MPKEKKNGKSLFGHRKLILIIMLIANGYYQVCLLVITITFAYKECFSVTHPFSIGIHIKPK